MATTTASTFGALLRRLRLAAGLTQEGLAERSGLSARGVQSLERGVSTVPRLETIRLLAEALELSEQARSELIATAYPEVATPPAATPAHPGVHGPPLPATPLVGREREVAAVCAMLHPGDGARTTRLLTLTGPGGVGKTRLALATAGELAPVFPDGVAWVDLAPVADPAQVAGAVAQALNVREAGGQALPDRLNEFLAARRFLLVLDNLEHLLPAAPFVATLLAAAPHLAVLGTSRTRLRLRGEQEFPVSPLALPELAASPPREGLAGVAAVRLFVERSAEVRPGFALIDENAAAVAAICRRLDGLPLAIELAAARVKLLPPDALLTRLTERLPLLTGGARDLPPRQQTMRDAIAWSHDLLTDDEQRLFRRLAVFAGGFTLDAAEQVAGGGWQAAAPSRPPDADLSPGCVPPSSQHPIPRSPSSPATRHPPPATLDLIASLLDKSLVRPLPGAAGEARFTMLETIREFAQERLTECGEADAARLAHATFVLRVVEDACQQIHGPRGPGTLARLEADHDNLRAALAWSFAASETALALRLIDASWRFWHMRSHLAESRSWFERLLTLPDLDDVAPMAHARFRALTGYVARFQGEYARATALGEEALAMAQRRDDRHGAESAHHLLGLIAMEHGRWDAARVHLEAAVALIRQRHEPREEAFMLSSLGEVALAQDRLADAAAYGESALAMWRAEEDAWGVAWTLVRLAKVARARGDFACAVALVGESLTTCAALGEREITARAVSELAAIAVARGSLHQAAILYGSVAALREAIGAPLAPVERARHETAVAAARDGLASEAFAAAWAAGRAVPLEQVNSEALRLSHHLS